MIDSTTLCYVRIVFFSYHHSHDKTLSTHTRQNTLNTHTHTGTRQKTLQNQCGGYEHKNIRRKSGFCESMLESKLKKRGNDVLSFL